MVMEASFLLVAPKPSVSALFSISRRCVIVAAAGHSKDTLSDGGNNGDQVLLLPTRKVVSSRGRGSLFAAAAATAMMCDDASAAVGDLVDPATAKTVASVAGPALSALGFLFILRIIMSWYPRLPVTKFPYLLAYAPTEPFLALTRKVIPPLGGVDVTPVVWFGLVSFLNEILVGPQGLLILLSQQQQQQL